MRYQTVQVHIAYKSPNGYLHLALRRSDSQRFYPSIWQTVTGKLEEIQGREETFIEAALREIAEETSINNNSIISVYNVPYVATFTDYRSNSVHNAPVIGVIVDTDEITLSDEHSDSKWIEPYEAAIVFDLYSHKIGASVFQTEILANPLNPYKLTL